MLRVILDTNIYGLIIDEKNGEQIAKILSEDQEFIIYGFPIIRKELRDIPKKLKTGRKNVRCYVLGVYDKIIKNKSLIHSEKTNRLAKKIYSKYREFGGIRNWDKTNIDRDLKIISCALVNKIDVVVSDNLRTLFSTPAKKSYQQIASELKFKLPALWTYNDLRRKYAFNE